MAGEGGFAPPELLPVGRLGNSLGNGLFYEDNLCLPAQTINYNTCVIVCQGLLGNIYRVIGNDFLLAQELQDTHHNLFARAAAPSIYNRLLQTFLTFPLLRVTIETCPNW